MPMRSALIVQNKFKLVGPFDLSHLVTRGL
jgi:hypothetical protein